MARSFQAILSYLCLSQIKNKNMPLLAFSSSSEIQKLTLVGVIGFKRVFYIPSDGSGRIYGMELLARKDSEGTIFKAMSACVGANDADGKTAAQS
jgi:hypothetical protein